MGRIAYVNGRYVPHAQACVHIEDRGYQFADGIYEVILLKAGRLEDLDGHLDRLERSAVELSLVMPVTRATLVHLLEQVALRNKLPDALIYLQITRGVAPRNHAFPVGVRPALVITAKRLSHPIGDEPEPAMDVITMPDIRWGRCDIKSVALLPNILAREQAKQQGAGEAWFVDRDGRITEGSSSNAWIVDAKGRLITRHLDKGILPGITRSVVAELAREFQITVEERAFTVAEAKAASEAFITGTSAYIHPVKSIDGHKIGDGALGPISAKLYAACLARANG
jgi:D-alanine transaminase